LQAAPATYYYEQQYHLPIPAAPGATQGWMNDAVLNVPDHVTIADLDVAINLTHTNVFDLQLYVQNPSGAIALLNMYDPANGYFHGANYSQTVFDDEATTSIRNGTAPFTGHFRPLDSLSVFDGGDAYGPWRLRVYDAFYADTGELQTFGLCITTPSSVPAPTGLALTLVGLGLIRRPRRQATPRRSF
jgi:subtilisin-like proprotein convertase family protein